MIEKSVYKQFSTLLLDWYDLYGRKDLPWQLPRHPYRVWVSEIMLQQTQVQTVIPYFNRFIQRFPKVDDLAEASEDEVLSFWSGLGYYSRARNLHTAAKLINEHYQGNLPEDLATLLKFPGIGPSTAAAILSQAFNLPTAILDGNVKRVLARFFVINGHPEQAQVKKKLWEFAQSCMPKQRCADYTQAIMDLGATCCTLKKPNCHRCPIKSMCSAFKLQQQDSYPTKKIKKPVPLRHQQFLVLYDTKGRIYLEKKPPSGLWAGLWCLPSLEMNACPISFIKEQHHLKGEEPQQLLVFKHRFSHFHLEINALSIKIASLANRVCESNGLWFKKEQLSSLGLAKPTSLILDKFF